MVIKVLVVDDSALMRVVISGILKEDSEISVCAFARDGKEAIEKTRIYKPDLILMDIEMPIMDGICAVKEIMKNYPVPIIMLTASSDNNSQRAFDATQAGAVDFILKPTNNNLDEIKNDLISRVKAGAKANVKKIFSSDFSFDKPKSHTFYSTSKKIILIASSTGGPQTVERLLKDIPGNIPAPILLVQHMPPIFTKVFAERLDKICDLNIKEAEDGDTLVDGRVLIAQGGKHMEVDSDGIIRLNEKPSELGVRPNANRMINSVVPLFKDKIICVVLTGMGQDGTEGSRNVKNNNGTVIAQSEKTSIIYGMPKSVVDSGIADLVLDIDKIAVSLMQLLDV